MSMLLIGLDNPQSRDPRYALFSRPAGCSGHKLLLMMQKVDPTFTEADYTRIPKTNLFPVGPASSKASVMSAAGALVVEQLRDSNVYVVACGKQTWDAMVLEVAGDTPMCEFVRVLGAQYAWIPHPSGRNREYNSAAVRRRVGEFLVQVWRRNYHEQEAKAEQGKAAGRGKHGSKRDTKGSSAKTDKARRKAEGARSKKKAGSRARGRSVRS